MKPYIFIFIIIFAFCFSAKVFPQQSEEKTYTVIKGDCLWKISKMNFASGKFWPEIWIINKEGVVNKEKIENPKRKVITNPNLIYPGQVLNIPKVKTLSDEQLKSAYKEARKHWADYRKNKAKINKPGNDKETKEQNKK